eukprot:6133978-Pleurochrysis_carterae.AAC.1
MGSCAPARAWRTQRGWTSRPYVGAGHSPPRSGDDTAFPPRPPGLPYPIQACTRERSQRHRHARHVPEDVRDMRGLSPQR